MRFIALLLALPLLAHAEPITHVGKIYFDAALAEQDRNAFRDALGLLEDRPLTNASPELFQIMKIPNGEAANVRAWLEERAQYIVNAATPDSNLKVVSTNYTFENPGVLPLDESEPAVPYLGQASVENGKVVMSNLGTDFYLQYKRLNTLATLDTNGLGQIPISSPRVGIILMGPGFYMMPAAVKELVKIFQLSTLLHEARHSDGHGTHTGFLHETCVEGTYQGLPVCDHSTNGPYEIESHTLRAFTQSCANCDIVAKLELQALWADSNGRLIHDAKTAEWDDTPEGHR